MSQSKRVFEFKSFFFDNYPEWITISRIKSEKMLRKSKNIFNEDFGENNWKIGYLWDEKIIDQSEALMKIEESYKLFFKDNPNLVNWLLETAKDIYVNSEDDVKSGQNYNIQESKKFHYVDITIRKVMQKNKVNFLGTELLKIENNLELIKKDDELNIANSKYHSSYLSPGFIPFIDFSQILESKQKGWWNSGSVEDFWRNNKVIIVKGSSIVDSSKTAVALVFRKDLKLGLGKFAVQASHGLVSAILTNGRSKHIDSWLKSQREIELRKVTSYDKLISLKKYVAKYNLATTVIRDAGHTQIPSGTTTCLAIGPAPKHYLIHLLNCFEAEKFK